MRSNTGPLKMCWKWVDGQGKRAPPFPFGQILCSQRFLSFRLGSEGSF